MDTHHVILDTDIGDHGLTAHAPGEPNCTLVLDPRRRALFDLLWERYPRPR